ncbi:MAG: hypothetical protein HY904_21005 [Deltaproteobacteria bacterium]|nr:hypothetical protein [Deltaproteobacteria bacterium]
MAARKRGAGSKELWKRVENIFADAVGEVKRAVDASLRAELADIIARTGKIGGKVGAKAKGKAKGKGIPGRPGRKPSWTPAQVDRLVDMVRNAGELVPQEARKKLKVSTTQLNGMVKTARADGRIKVSGKGRGTRYVKG